MRRTILVMTMVVLISAGPSVAAMIEGVSFADRQSVAGSELTLRGAALLRYLVFIKAYVGAFYLQAGEPADRALDGQVTRRLVLHYFHEIAGVDFAEATTEMIKKNVSPDRFAALQSKINELNGFYRDVKPGDRYTATYVPGVGTELALNDEVLGVVPGPEFSAAFFSIWIGNNPIDDTFRDRLLGER